MGSGAVCGRHYCGLELQRERAAGTASGCEGDENEQTNKQARSSVASQASPVQSKGLGSKKVPTHPTGYVLPRRLRRGRRSKVKPSTCLKLDGDRAQRRCGWTVAGDSPVPSFPWAILLARMEERQTARTSAPGTTTEQPYRCTLVQHHDTTIIPSPYRM